jgi:hypothetical protein
LVAIDRGREDDAGTTSFAGLAMPLLCLDRMAYAARTTRLTGIANNSLTLILTFCANRRRKFGDEIERDAQDGQPGKESGTGKTR